jgi:hypothetical protein
VLDHNDNEISSRKLDHYTNYKSNLPHDVPMMMMTTTQPTTMVWQLHNDNVISLRKQVLHIQDNPNLQLFSVAYSYSVISYHHNHKQHLFFNFEKQLFFLAAPDSKLVQKLLK